MTCDRCNDIHKAQRDGRTQRECGCSCHRTFYTGTNTFTTSTGTNNINFWTDTASASTGSALDLSGNEAF